MPEFVDRIAAMVSSSKELMPRQLTDDPRSSNREISKETKYAGRNSKLVFKRSRSRHHDPSPGHRRSGYGSSCWGSNASELTKFRHKRQKYQHVHPYEDPMIKPLRRLDRDAVDVCIRAQDKVQHQLRYEEALLGPVEGPFSPGNFLSARKFTYG